MLIEIVTDFVLFSGIEGFLLCLFFERIGNCRKFKWYEWLISSLGNCLISKLLPPLLYQVIILIWLTTFLYIGNRNSLFGSLKLSFQSLAFFLICEMLVSMLYELVLGIEFTNINNLKLFVSMIPVRIIEILFIRRWNTMKLWMGSVVCK